MEATRPETSEKSERQGERFLITVSRADFITWSQGAGTRHHEMWKRRVLRPVKNPNDKVSAF